jgi:hypothetical protein
VGEQTASFMNGFKMVQTFLQGEGYEIVAEYKGLKQMRDDKHSFREVVNWLLGSHMHFVITHPHQGMHSATGCGVDEIYKELSRLW